jgi:hypothetical protein
MDRPEGLTALRQQFRDGGFREQERKVTYALKWHDEVGYWTGCSQGSASACFELFLNRLFFDWMCSYGLQPERALVLLTRLYFCCALLYWGLLRFSRRGGLYLIPSRYLATGSIKHPLIQRIRPRARISPLPPSAPQAEGRIWVRAFAYFRTRPHRRLRRRARQQLTLLRAAFFFSTISAFNISFRGVVAGRWVRQLTKREYEIKAQGWPRVVAGFQALASVGLLGLWVLTYFGRPFG